VIRTIASFGATATVIALVGLGGIIAVQRDRLADKQAMIDDQAACVASIRLAPRADRPSVKCDLVVSTAVIRAQQSIDCDSALAGGAVYRTAASCSPMVKVVVADRDTARIERDGLQADLARLRADQAAALNRAAKRAKTQAHKETLAHAALDDAPVDGAGLTVCSADCLRQLAGEEPRAPGGGPTR